MRKKLCMLVMFIFMFTMGPSLVFAADTFKVVLDCGNANVGKTGKCTVRATSTGGTVSAFHGKVSVTGNASFVSFTPGSGWSGDGNGGVIDIYTDISKSGTFTLGTVTYKGNQAGNASLVINDVMATHGGNEIDGDNAFMEFTTASGAAKTFKIIAPTTTTTTKKTTTTTNKITMPSSKTTSTSKLVIPTGPTTSTTTLTNPSHGYTTTSSMYITSNVLNTTRTTMPALKLTSVTVDDFKVVFKNGVYYVTVKSDTEAVNVRATAPADITVYGTGPRTLAIGKNLVELVLRNPQNQTTTYQVIITRPDPSGIYDLTLSQLRVVDYEFDFNPDILEYTIKVPYNTGELYVLAEAYSKDVIVTGDGLVTMEEGRDAIYVNVSYGDIASQDYIIHIKSYLMPILWGVIGLISAALVGMSIYAYLAKEKAVKKVTAIKDREIVNSKRIATQSAQNVNMEINGQNVLGVGRRIATPVPVAESPVQNVKSIEPVKVEPVKTVPTPAPTQVVTNAPEAQVKVIKKTVVPTQVKTINTSTPLSATYSPEDIVVTDLDK